MSVHDALRFIQQVGDDELLKEKLRALGPDVDLEEIVEAGAEAGFEFTAEELRTAFVKDWSMRRFYYSGIVE
ncbi:MAG: Nif11-like leader peptide family natural product precursor [Acidobacteriota bacterium]